VLSLLAQVYTQHAGRRPPAVTALMIGLDEDGTPQVPWFRAAIFFLSFLNVSPLRFCPPSTCALLHRQNLPYAHLLTNPTQLYKADPSGWYAGYRAAAIGQKGEEANNIFEKKLRAKPALPANEPIVTGLIALQSALGVDLKANEVEVGVCSKDAPRFRNLSEAEVRFAFFLLV
jgi:20S proteasome alpha/beta subunit